MKHIIYPLFILIISIILQGCFVTKTYQAPQLVSADSILRVPDEFTINYDQAQEWDSFYQDTLLQHFIHRALTNNLDIQIAYKNLQISRELLKQKKANYLPSAAISVSGSYQKPSSQGIFGEFLDNPYQLYEINIPIQWTPDLFGNMKSDEKAASAALNNQLVQQEALKTQVISAVASTYYNIIFLKQKHQIFQKTVELKKQQWNALQKMQEIGLANQFEVENAAAFYHHISTTLPELKQAIIVQENFLSVLIGLPPQELNLNFHELKAPTIKYSIPIQFLASHPEVMAAEFNLRKKFELTNMAKSEFYPSFNISASAGLQAIEIENWFNTSALFGNIMAGIAQPVLNKRKIRSNYNIALREQEMAFLQFKNQVLTISEEVSNQLYSYSASTERLKTLSNTIKILESAELHANILFDVGRINFIDLLKVQEDLLNAQVQIIDIESDKTKAAINIFRNTGKIGSMKIDQNLMD